VTSTAQESKVVCQYRRARRLAAALAATYPSPVVALEVAGSLPVDGWATTARYVGIRPPSPDTVALTIELLRERSEEA
jgi:hypothetical protein